MWSFGLLLYELLVMEDVSVVAADGDGSGRRAGEAPSLDALAADLTASNPDVVALLRQCFAVAPDERPTAEAAFEVLEAVLASL